MNIKSARISCLIVLAFALALPAGACFASATSPGTPAPAVSRKLDARLATIAHAAAEQRLAPLMGAALDRELTRSNSPLEARWNAAGQVQVYLHYDSYRIPPSRTQLRALGASGVVTSPALGVVQAWVPATQLDAVAALPQVARVTVPRYAYVKRAPHSGAIPRTGSVDTQGDQILGAAAFRQATGFNGSGTSVGVISDGAGDISQDQSTGDLPSNPAPWVNPSLPGSGYEGTAMMEIIYDLAPGAKLGFCGPQTSVDFITCLNDFASNSAGFLPNVIVDDLGFPGVAMFTDGGFATAVQQFAQAHPNIQLVSAAGNDATGFWSGIWNPTPVNTTINSITYTQAQNFGSTSNPNTKMSFAVQPGDTIDYLLEWDDTWIPSSQITKSTPNDPNDYDVFLVDGNGNILACNQGDNLGGSATPPSPASCPYTNTPAGPTGTPGPQPVQGNQWKNSGSSTATVYLEIFYGGGNPGKNLKVLVNSVSANQMNLTPHTAAGSIFGQSALPYPDEITVGAISASGASNGNDVIESYSSQGPVFLSQPATGTSTRMKPDFVGVDCVSVTGVGGFVSPFCGTSAAAPHIAGLIALLESGYPQQNPYTLLKNGATHLGTGYPNGVYGYGLVNVLASVASLYPAPSASIISPGANATINTGQTTTFSSNCSSNGAPGSMKALWNFGGGSNIPDSTQMNPTVTYSGGGVFTVTLTCSNAFGASASTTRTITVKVVTPTSTGGGGGGGLGFLSLLALLLAAWAARLPRAKSAIPTTSGIFMQ